MADSEDISSGDDSDIFGDGSTQGSLASPRHSARQRMQNVNSGQVGIISSSLKDTNRNLRSVDRMLGTYRDLNTQQSSSMERLRGDLDKTMDQLKEERIRASAASSASVSPDLSRPLRSSDLEVEDGIRVRRRRRGPSFREFGRSSESDIEASSRRRGRAGRSAVRFTDDMTASTEEVHEIHQNVRDLSTDQHRLRDDLNRELDRRNKDEIENRRSMIELSDSLRRSNADLSDSVEKRLHNIQEELKGEKKTTEQRRYDVGRLSTELRQALQQQQQQPQQVPALQSAMSAEESMWKHRLSQADTQKKQIEGELENIKRRFDQSEGSKVALVRQMEELRHQLSNAEKDRTTLRSKLEEMKTEEELKERKRYKTAKEERENERRNLEREIKELKQQISRSTHLGSQEIEDVRRTLDRTERQKSQLSDSVEVMKKDMENKEKHILKLMTELQEFKIKYEECERQRNTAVSQLEDALRQLRDLTREADRYADELKKTDNQLQETEIRQDEMRTRATETVKMWKLKCKRLEKELEKYRTESEQLNQKNTHLTKDHEQMKVQFCTASQQLENMKREMGDILQIRAQQEEHLRLRDAELSDIKAIKCDLDKDVRDYRGMNEKLKEELHSSEVMYAQIKDERGHLEEKLSSVEAQCLVAQDECKTLRRELQEVSLLKAELSAQTQEMQTQRTELKNSLMGAHHIEQTLREEISLLSKQNREENEKHLRDVEQLRRQMEDIKAREIQTVQDMSRRMKRDQAEFEAEIQALKIDVSEHRSAYKMLKAKDDKSKDDIDKLHDEIGRLEDDNTVLKRKILKIRQEYQTKLQIADDDISRARKVEEELLDVQDCIKKLERDQRNILHSIGVEVNGLVELATLDSSETYDALSPGKCHSDPQRWLADMKSKLQWLQSQMKEQRTRETRLKIDMKDAVQSVETDRKLFVNELEKQNEVLEDLVIQKQFLAQREALKTDEVQVLEEQVHELSNSLRRQKEENLNKSIELEAEKHYIIEEIKDIQDSNKERDRIHERYAKLQETVNRLRDELLETRKCADEYKMDKLDADLQAARISATSSPSSSPKPKRRVRIEENVPTHDRHSHRSSRLRSSSPLRASSPVPLRPVPRSSSPAVDQKTPQPLYMTDDEFRRSFIPKSPVLGSYDDLDII
ncbi:centrosomal protein of 128 kDa-like [Tubulanus polymorphus]|uniref:centrosomal protein of 128 kDa-like n=1 Tax=Tubulanus polymorphus TaxID=672921 RepID=UPI003DA6504C